MPCLQVKQEKRYTQRHSAVSQFQSLSGLFFRFKGIFRTQIPGHPSIFIQIQSSQTVRAGQKRKATIILLQEAHYTKVKILVHWRGLQGCLKKHFQIRIIFVFDAVPAVGIHSASHTGKLEAGLNTTLFFVQP